MAIMKTKKFMKKEEKALLEKFGSNKAVAEQLGITYEHYCLIRRKKDRQIPMTLYFLIQERIKGEN